MKSVRRWLFSQLDPQGWSKTGLSPVNKVIALTIGVAVFFAVVETEKEFRIAYVDAFNAADWIFGVIFSVEYIARVYSCVENEKYASKWGRLKYIFSPVAIIDLIAIIPFIASAGIQDAFLLRLFRLLRIISLAKFGRYSTALRIVYLALFSRRYELLVSLGVAFLVMLFAASALHVTEGALNPEHFGSIPRALWWGAATITKVGYGGAFPVTILGKFFAGVFAIAAVGVVAIPTGILAASFSSAFRRDGDK